MCIVCFKMSGWKPRFFTIIVIYRYFKMIVLISLECWEHNHQDNINKKLAGNLSLKLQSRICFSSFDQIIWEATRLLSRMHPHEHTGTFSDPNVLVHGMILQAKSLFRVTFFLRWNQQYLKVNSHGCVQLLYMSGPPLGLVLKCLILKTICHVMLKCRHVLQEFSACFLQTTFHFKMY